MKAVVQRVASASVRADGEELARIGPGMLVLVGALRGDGEAQAARLAERIARLRFFADEHDRMNLSALDLGREALVVSQFTLAADGRRGRRPSFDAAADPREAEGLIEVFVARLRSLGIACRTGRFGARMQVELVNDGPVTFCLDEARPAPAGSGGPSQALA